VIPHLKTIRGVTSTKLLNIGPSS